MTVSRKALPIYVTQPSLPPLEEFIPYLQQIWESKRLTNSGPFHQQFEQALCDYLGVKHLALFANGTLALVTALQALRINGEVITTPFSFVATALIKQYRRVGNYDVLIVGYAGHIDIFLAKILNLFRKKPLIFDAFLSLYDTAVMDRKIVSRNSLKARLLWQVDRWACRGADAGLPDPQGPVEYFVRGFRLPPEKFFAVPVGSSMKTQGNPPISQIPLNPPLLKGEIGGFTVLYFGSYIPLHGVDVILKAAKI